MKFVVQHGSLRIPDKGGRRREVSTVPVRAFRGIGSGRLKGIGTPSGKGILRERPSVTDEEEIYDGPHVRHAAASSSLCSASSDDSQGTPSRLAFLVL